MARWILLLVSAGAMLAQTHVAKSTRTTVTSDKLTLAHDPANQTRIQVCRAIIQSTTAGTVTVEVAGAAATATAATPAATRPGGPTAKALAYSASDVGAGTSTAILENLVANVPYTLDLRHVRLSGNGTTKNMTVVIAIASGNVTSAIYWAEDENCQRQ